MAMVTVNRCNKISKWHCSNPICPCNKELIVRADISDKHRIWDCPHCKNGTMIFDGYSQDIIIDIKKEIKIKHVKTKQGKEILKIARRKRNVERVRIEESRGSILITQIIRYCPKCDKIWKLDIPGSHSLCPKCNGLLLLPMTNNS